MIVLKVTDEFTLGDFDKLKNIVRANPNKNEKGTLYRGDEFECDKAMADYITGGNRFGVSYAVIKEIIPEVRKEIKKETRVRTPKKIDKKK